MKTNLKFILIIGVAAILSSISLVDAAFHCSSVRCLISAINAANATGKADTIKLEAGVYSLQAAAGTNIDGPNGLPSITTAITIVGKDPNKTIIERDPTLGVPEFRIVHVGESGNLSLSDLTIKGGFLGGFSGDIGVAGGPGVYNRGTTAITNSIIEENVSDRNAGGGILNIGGTVIVANSIIADNLVIEGGLGGGVANFAGMLTVTNSTIANNTADEAGGGGILNRGGFVTVRDSSIIGNETGTFGFGGGIANDANGTMLIVNSTIGENVAGFGGGGGINSEEGTIIIVNSTIAGNVNKAAEEQFNVGGIVNIFSLGTIVLRNSIIAGNTGFLDPEFPVPSAPDCGGSITSLGNNLIGDPTNCNVNLLASDLTGDPGLGTFADDGTPGNGHFPLLANSQAINAGDDDFCPNRDQIGNKRKKPCDIGAVEAVKRRAK